MWGESEGGFYKEDLLGKGMGIGSGEKSLCNVFEIGGEYGVLEMLKIISGEWGVGGVGVINELGEESEGVRERGGFWFWFLEREVSEVLKRF